MQVRSRQRQRSAGRAFLGAQASATLRGPGAREQIRAFADLLNSSDPRRIAAGTAGLRSLIENAQGPYLGPDELAAALKEEIDHGPLGGSPEAITELARYLSQHGERDAAKSRLTDACRIVADVAATDRPEARARASAVNREASLLYRAMNDPYQGTARDAVSRFYSTPATRRFAGDRIPKVPSPSNWYPGDAMSAPTPHVPVPPRLEAAAGAEDPDPQTPQHWEDEDLEDYKSISRREQALTPYAPMQAVDLANQIATFVGAMRNLNELSTYLARCERASNARDYWYAPMRPDALRSLRADVDEKLRSSDPRVRRVGEELSRRLDFELLDDCSKAYWGVGW